MPHTQESSTKRRRDEILDSTTELFLKKGFSGTSMSAVAKACGIKKARLYHHFPGKDDLFAACVTHG
ncbi:MAG: TetR/AcrR family transcriptional regulator [Pseudomonadota bacterium]